MHACALPELPFPSWLTFTYKKLGLSNFPSDAGRASVTIHSGSARVQNVICATVGKRVRFSFKCGVYGRVFKIRPVQDSAVWYRRKWSIKLVVLPLVMATDARHCRHRICLVNIILLVVEIMPDN